MRARGVARGGAHGARAPPLLPKIVQEEYVEIQLSTSPSLSHPDTSLALNKLRERKARCIYAVIVVRRVYPHDPKCTERLLEVVRCSLPISRAEERGRLLQTTGEVWALAPPSYKSWLRPCVLLLAICITLVHCKPGYNTCRAIKSHMP